MVTLPNCLPDTGVCCSTDGCCSQAWLEKLSVVNEDLWSTEADEPHTGARYQLPQTFESQETQQKREAESRMGRDRRESQRAKRMNGNMQLFGVESMRLSRKSQRAVMRDAPRTQRRTLEEH